jgi:hypothetical protein
MIRKSALPNTWVLVRRSAVARSWSNGSSVPEPACTVHRVPSCCVTCAQPPRARIGACFTGSTVWKMAPE